MSEAKELVEEIPAVSDDFLKVISAALDKLPPDIEKEVLKLLEADTESEEYNKKGFLSKDSDTVKYLMLLIDEHGGDFAQDIKQGTLDKINVALGEAIGTMGDKFEQLNKNKITKNGIKILGAAVVLLAVFNPDIAFAAEPLQNFCEFGEQFGELLGDITDAVADKNPMEKFPPEAAQAAERVASVPSFTYNFADYATAFDAVEAAPKGDVTKALSEYFFSGMDFSKGANLAPSDLMSEFRSMIGNVSDDTLDDVRKRMFDLFLKHTNAGSVDIGFAEKSFNSYMRQLAGVRS